MTSEKKTVTCPATGREIDVTVVDPGWAEGYRPQDYVKGELAELEEHLIDFEANDMFRGDKVGMKKGRNKRNWLTIFVIGAILVAGFATAGNAARTELPIRAVIVNICQMQDKVEARKICDERGWPCPCVR